MGHSCLDESLSNQSQMISGQNVDESADLHPPYRHAAATDRNERGQVIGAKQRHDQVLAGHYC